MAKKADAALYRLLVDLAEFDPETARPGDWLNYRAGLDMLAWAGHSQRPRPTRIFNVGNPQRLGDIEAEVRPIHADLRKIVRKFAAGGAVQSVPISVEVAAVGGAAPWTLVTGGTRDTALLNACSLLTRPARPPIALCPEDDRLFVKVRRQQFCSRQCVNRANVRAYRERMKPKDKTQDLTTTKTKRRRRG